MKYLLALALLVFAHSAFAAPEDHLATVPEATQEEKEVLSLLQFGPQFIDGNGRVTVRVYNPTKYTLLSCVMRVSFPNEKISRIYYSEGTTIPPFKDGEFDARTALYGKKTENMKVELLTIKYAKKEK